MKTPCSFYWSLTSKSWQNYKLYTTVRKLGAKLRNENQSVAVHMIIFQTQHRSMLLINCWAKKRSVDISKFSNITNCDSPRDAAAFTLIGIDFSFWHIFTKIDSSCIKERRIANKSKLLKLTSFLSPM